MIQWRQNRLEFQVVCSLISDKRQLTLTIFMGSGREIKQRILSHNPRVSRSSAAVRQTGRAYNSCMLHDVQQFIAPAVFSRLTLLLNHVLASEAVATQRLKPHAGRSVCLQFQGWPSVLPRLPDMVFVITPAGLLEWQAQPLQGAADLTLEIEASNPAMEIMRRLTGQAPRIQITGDSALAADVSWVTDNLRWDLEDDVARLVGQGPAHEIARVARTLASGLRGMVGFAMSRSASASERDTKAGSPGAAS
jgi:ubiquinone biosynthesis accessory factor UbiJ